MKKFVFSGLIALLVFSLQITFAGAVDRSPVKPPLERKIRIHYKQNFAKPPSVGGKKASACYDVLSRGAKLKTIKDLVVYPDLDIATIATSAATWDGQTSTSLFGNLSSDTSANWDGTAPDGRNEFSYDNYPEPGVIAVTVSWGYFAGPPQTREIVEFDILFDTDYAWGDAGSNATLMDLENIATHEIGHGIGLADIYDSGCSQVTMFGYSDYGEISKRTLELPDVRGLQSLYGI